MLKTLIDAFLPCLGHVEVLVNCQRSGCKLTEFMQFPRHREASTQQPVAAVGLPGARAPQLLHSVSRNTLHKMPEPQCTCTSTLCCHLGLQWERPCHCMCQDPGIEGILGGRRPLSVQTLAQLRPKAAE